MYKVVCILLPGEIELQPLTGFLIATLCHNSTPLADQYILTYTLLLILCPHFNITLIQ